MTKPVTAAAALLVLVNNCVGMTGSPADLAGLAGRAAVDEFGKTTSPIGDQFGGWNYCGGTIQMGLWEMLPYISETDSSHIKGVIIPVLEEFKKNGSGYDILTNATTLPFGYSVGDQLSQYPTAYAKKTEHMKGEPTDYQMVENMARRVEEFPHHLPTGLVSRKSTWSAVGSTDPKGRGVWADDGFMGTSVMVASNVSDLVMEASFQLKLLHKVLNDDNDDLYHHGALANSTPAFQSCCKWGRANGWTVMAKADTLAAMVRLSMPVDSELLADFQSHLTAILKHQDATSGMFHNVLNQTETPLELSVTGMTLHSLLMAFRYNFIDNTPQHVSQAELMYSAIANSIHPNGSISNIKGGTGIKNSWKDYGTPGPYTRSGPGLGGVLRGLAAYLRYKSDN
eukprot:TRINITY_DN2442_c0_g1_i1.p1 TRINITY_DN2442_c0_g1~~TRINITY_DN2442_c0_g1_i1.p1  ORF type:complete len:397 (+),score=83.54 TRINITY_DN2442_c0_g1_i1:51-1241(+)